MILVSDPWFTLRLQSNRVQPIASRSHASQYSSSCHCPLIHHGTIMAVALPHQVAWLGPEHLPIIQQIPIGLIGLASSMVLACQLIIVVSNIFLRPMQLL